MDAMKSQQRMFASAVVTALLLSGLLASSASASSLLSGYGGPGQGNQAILGATLLNGPGEGGGGAGSQGGPPAGAAGAIAVGESRSAAGPSSGGRSHGSAGGGAAGPAARARTKAPQGATLPTAREAAVSSPTLGISGADLLYILLGLGALAVTGVLTRRLARHR